MKLESERGINVDFILQCGDAGIFPDLLKLDRATLKHASVDKSEIGFSRFFTTPDARIKELLNGSDFPMICVRGNHEDHGYLDGLELKHTGPCFPVDCYNRIFVLKTGEICTLTRNNECVNIMGIGRIGSRNMEKSQRYLQDYERKKLERIQINTQIDILITHDSALDFVTHGYGMPEIRYILNRYEPRYHFFGHTGTPFTNCIDENNFTASVKVAELRLTENRTLSEGSVLLLKWSDYDDNHLEMINDNWIKDLDPSVYL